MSAFLNVGESQAERISANTWMHIVILNGFHSGFEANSLDFWLTGTFDILIV